MAHAEDIEQAKEKEQLIEEWKRANGITDESLAKDAADGQGWLGFLKKLLVQPGLWVFLTILTISPYGVDIVKAILQFCQK